MAPLEMNAGTSWGKNTIGPSDRGVEKPHEVTLTFFILTTLHCDLVELLCYTHFLRFNHPNIEGSHCVMEDL
jgi:hypothetical protein